MVATEEFEVRSRGDWTLHWAPHGGEGNDYLGPDGAGRALGVALGLLGPLFYFSRSCCAVFRHVASFCGFWGIRGLLRLLWYLGTWANSLRLLGCHSFFAVRMVSCAADSRPMNWLVNLVSFANAPQTRALMLIHTQVAKA